MKKAILLIMLAVLATSAAAFNWDTQVIIPDFPVESYANFTNATIQELIVSSLEYNQSDVTIDDGKVNFPFRYSYADGYEDENGTMRIAGMSRADAIYLDVDVIDWCVRNYNVNICSQYLVSGTQPITIQINGDNRTVNPLLYQYYVKMARVYFNMINLRYEAQEYISQESARQNVRAFLQGINPSFE